MRKGSIFNRILKFDFTQAGSFGGFFSYAIKKMRSQTYNLFDSKVWVINMTSSTDVLTKLSKKYFTAFTQFDNSVFVKKCMQISDSQEMSIRFYFCPAFTKNAWDFLDIFWFRLLKIELPILVQWDFTWSFVVRRNQLTKKIISDFLSREIFLTHKTWINIICQEWNAQNYSN